MTLTSYGMAQRSRPQGRDASAVVALWKDPSRGTREIPLEAGAHAVLLTTCGGRGSRRTVDGRRPVGNVTDWFNVGVSQIRAAPAGSGPPPSIPHRPTPQLLDPTESAPTLDALISALDSARDQEGIDRLARTVLRSALEQRRFRAREIAS